MNEEKMQIFIVTGYSGAGKSSVLRALEDLDFFCVDNLPIGFITSFFHFVSQPNQNFKNVALGVDIRSGTNIHELIDQLLYWSKQKYSIKTIFLTASSSILLKRFQETRRKHPLNDMHSLTDAIAYEKQLLKPLSEIANLVIDTDTLNIHELRAFVRGSLSQQKPVMMVTLVSFGFKYGVPPESNFVYDLRSLPNPYFVPALKELDGTQNDIKEFLFAQDEVKQYWAKLEEFVKFAIDRAYHEGRFFMNVAFGCTGGRHRSVAFIEELAQLKLENVQFLIKHRDIYKDEQK